MMGAQISQPESIGIVLMLTLLIVGVVIARNRKLRRNISTHLHELGHARQIQLQATRALTESEERFRALIESSSDMIWELDRYGAYTYVSPHVRDILGYEPDELVGHSAFSLMTPADSSKMLTWIRATTADSVIDGEVNTFTHQDGRKVILECSGRAFVDSAGELAGFRGVSHDITKRVAADAALKESEERFRSLVETTSDWIWEIDQQGRFIYSSPQATDFLGYAPSELIGKRLMDLMPQKEAIATRFIFTQKVEHGATINSMENVYHHKDGRSVVLENSAVPFYDTDWKIIGYRGIGRNITERRLAEEELLRLRNLLGNIINSMPSILAGVDTNGRVMQWNREAERATGITAEQAQGQELAKVFPDIGNSMPRVLAAIGNHDVQYLRRIPCTLDGTACTVDVTVYPITDDGAEGAVIRVDDVSDRVRIEEMMMQSEKMMSVGGLAAGMAHEINNPLAGMLQYLQVMRNRIVQNTERNQVAADKADTSLSAIQNYMQERGLVDMMDSAIDAGRRAAKIVDNMLCFSRKGEGHFERNNLEEILEYTLELASNDYNLKKRFDFRHIRIHRSYDNTLGSVPCESSQIQQVLLNLLSNSAQAMAEHPDPGREPHIILRLRKEAHDALIEVEDNGPGMDAETRKRAFEPFFTTKDVGHGTGLGLSVSYFIITENHGGTMDLDSAPGRGTRFSIRLPFEHRQTRMGLRI